MSADSTIHRPTTHHRPTIQTVEFEPNLTPSLARSPGERGQSLVEYLILVALMGVASIAVVRVLSQTVHAQFATTANALRGSPKKISAEAPDQSSFKKKDLSNFIDGVAARSRASSAEAEAAE